MDYNHVFCNHVIRLMKSKKLTKQELANRANISVSFVSDLTNGKANPSLKIMRNIANALDIPLPMLLLSDDGEIWSLARACIESSTLGEQNEPVVSNPKEIPNGFEYIEAILPAQKAFIVRQWATPEKKTRRKIGK